MIIIYLALIYVAIGFLVGTAAVKYGFLNEDTAEEDFWYGFIGWPLILAFNVIAAPVVLINKYIAFIAK